MTMGAETGLSAFVRGTGLTAFGRLEGSDTLGLMSMAAEACLADAGVERGEVDGLLTGYSTTLPHLMLATVFAEHFGLDPHYCHCLAAGGATGGAAIMLAKLLVESGQCRNVLVVAGENRLSHSGGRDSAIQTLAQVGHARFEVPYGATIPGYYALLASEYMNRHGLDEEDMAQIAVHMRGNAVRTEGAHLRDAITTDDVMNSRAIATPLKLLDCCPISDGGAAVLVSADGGERASIRIAGAGQAHRHQHISAIGSIDRTGASDAAARAFRQAGRAIEEIGILGIYDSFTITLAMLLEEIGFSERGASGPDIAEGRYDPSRGGRTLNGHGGLLSYGHSGVAGGMAHFVDVVRRMQASGGGCTGFVHADGGVLSSHVSLVLETE